VPAAACPEPLDPVDSLHGVRCADGLRLSAHQTAPPSGWNGRVVIIAGALAVPIGLYRGLARFLAGRGYRVIRFAYRGMSAHGRASTRAAPLHLRDWGREDIEAILRWVRQEYRPRRMLMFGHSIGGQLIGLAPSAPQLDGLVLFTSPSGYWGYYPYPHKLKAWLMWHLVVPGITRVGTRIPMRLFGLGNEDVPASIAAEWARWGRCRDYLFDPVHGLDIDGYASIRCPLHAYYTDDDWLAPEAAVTALLAHYPHARIRRFPLRAKTYDLAHLGHFRMFSRAMAGSFWVELAGRLEEMCRE